jgi:hypothetical protein
VFRKGSHMREEITGFSTYSDIILTPHCVKWKRNNIGQEILSLKIQNSDPPL